MKFQTKKRIVTTGLWLVIAVALAAVLLEEQTALYGAGILMGLWAVAALAFWRCPKCGKFLGKISSGVTVCRFCGTKLDEEEPQWLRNRPTQN